MRKITTLTFLLVSTLGWSQNDSIRVEKKVPVYDSVITNYVQRNALNPATAGIFNRNNLQADYQFNIYDFPVTKLFVGFDKSFGKNDGWGFGVNYRKENYNNTIISKHVGINLSKNLRIKKHTTAFGFGVEYFQTGFNWNNATFGDMIDPRRGFIYQTQDLPRGGTVSGLSYHIGITHTYKSLKLGASALNFTQPNNSLTHGWSFIPTELSFNIGYSIALKGFDIVPIYNITRNNTITNLNLKLLTIYQNQYFLSGGVQINQTRNYNFSGGIFLLNNFHAEASYSITPRYLDYAHVFSIKLAYIFNIKKSNS